MKKLTTYILAAFLSVSVASSAFSDHEGEYRDHPKDSVNAQYFNCAFIREQAADDVRSLRTYQIVLNGSTSPRANAAILDKLSHGLQNANAWANIYQTFCK